MGLELALIDMDGTIYSGNSAINGVNEALELLHERGVDTLFLTNYAGNKRVSYSQKLNDMDIEASSSDVLTSGRITANYLTQKFPEAEVFVLGEEELKEEMRKKGITVSESCNSPDVLVVSNKHNLSYSDLKEVLQGIGEDTKLIGTNPDETIPGENGEVPGAGTIIRAVEAMTGRDIEVVGKPSKRAVKAVTEMKSVSPEDCLIIGDRLNTDILMGAKNRTETALVLSGVTDRAEISDAEVSPDHVLDSISDIEEIF